MGAVAGLLGGPLGGVFALGAGILLQFLFPQKIEGPRQEDTRASTSKYGDPIGRVIGTARIAGNPFWLQGDKIREKKNKYRQGKGGPIVTEYTYSSTSAYVFDYDGPAEGILRLWLDDELVYDNTKQARDLFLAATGKGFGVAAGCNFTFYLGTADQQPDSRIVADKGASTVSAFRGCVYIVIENLDHQEIGIRLPNFEAEICKRLGDAGDPYDAALVYGSTKLLYGGSRFEWLPVVGTKSIAFYPTNGTGGQESVYFFDLETKLYTGMNTPTFPSYGVDGGMYLHSDDTRLDIFSNGVPARISDLYTIQRGSDLTESMEYETRAHAYNVRGFIFNGATPGHRVIYHGDNIEYLSGPTSWEDTDYGPPDLYWRFSPTEIDTDIATLSIRGLAPVGGRHSCSGVIAISSSQIEFNGGGAITLTGFGTGILGVVWAVSSSVAVVRAANGFFKVNSAGTLLASRLEHGSSSSAQFVCAQGLTSDGYIWYADEDGGSVTYYKMDPDDLSIVESIPGIAVLEGSLLNPQIAYVEEALCWLRRAGVDGTNTAYFIDEEALIRRGAVDLGPLLNVGLSGMSIDVTGVGKTIKGYAVKGDIAWRGVLDDICRILSVDHAQVDGVYKFWGKHNTSALVIGDTHVGAKLSDTGFGQDGVEELLADELDKPIAFTINYPSFDASYRIGSQRIDIPLNTSESFNEIAITTSVVMDDTEAAQATDVLLRESREVPDEYTFSLPPRYAKLHVGDVITLPLEGSQTIKLVIDEIQDDLVLKIKAHRRTIDYASDAIGVDTPDPTGSKLSDAEVLFVPMDMNMLRDDDADNTNGFYMGAYYDGTIPPGAMNVWRSLDAGDTYEGWTSFTSYLVVGTLASITDDDTLSPYVPHPDAEFIFRPFGGDVPDSVSEAEWVEGALPFALETSTGEWEVVLVHTLVDNGNGSYTATGLVRGYRGTETLITGHAVGNRVVYLDQAKMGRTNTGYPNVEQFLVALASGLEFNEADAFSFTNYGRSLKPYRPVHITGARDTGATENLTVSWVRQSRYNWSWEDGTEDVPLNEDTEEYEVEYRTSDGVTLLRTRLAVTSPTDEYTLTEYQTDSGDGAATVIPSLQVTVYQISQDYTVNNGRGYPGVETL